MASLDGSGDWTGPRRALHEAAETLRRAGVREPQIDAELLLALAAGTTREHIITTSIDLDDAARGRYVELVRRRAARVPLAYITGHREFYSIDLEVAPDVLIPRPETETLVTTALSEIAGRSRPSMLDIGTGSGAIAIAIAANTREARIVATDISAAAIKIASHNAARIGVSPRIEFINADCFESLTQQPIGRFDLIVSNPPYIRDAEFATLMPEVRDFEPRIALAGGADGMDFYRRIAAGLAQHLAPAGAVMVEVGAGQASAVITILREAGLDDLGIDTDLAGVARVVRARRRTASS